MKFKKINLARLKARSAVLILVIVAAVGGYFVGRGSLTLSKGKVTISREIPQNRQDVDFSLFWRTWDTLEASYYDKSKIDKKAMVYGAIKGMVGALGDPYTVFLPPEENKVVQEDLSGNFEGVGIQIGFRGSQLAVIAPLPNTPAEKAGIKAGDLIVGITDEIKDIDRSTVGITLPEAVQIIRGPSGTTVTLTILRDGVDEPLVLDVTRGAIDVPSIILSFEKVGEGKVAHLQLLKFGAETYSEWEKAVREILKEEQVIGIVLDLRNNPGGFLDSSVEIASDFVDSGSTIVIQENADKSRENFTSKRFGRLKNIPTVVLVNEGSASASEILAGALRDLRKIQLVGATTFGKGTIQEPIQVNGGSGLHVTTARWLTPNETWVNDEGLKPDVEIDDNPDTPEDEELQKAIELIQSIN